MAPRQIKKTELADFVAAEHSEFSLVEAGDAVEVVLDAIDELGGEAEFVEVGDRVGEEPGVVVKASTRFDPADPPTIDLESAAIPDEGVIGAGLFGRRPALFRARTEHPDPG